MTPQEAKETIDQAFGPDDGTGDLFKAIVVLEESALELIRCASEIKKIWTEPIR